MSLTPAIAPGPNNAIHPLSPAGSRVCAIDLKISIPQGTFEIKKKKKNTNETTPALKNPEATTRTKKKTFTTQHQVTNFARKYRYTYATSTASRERDSIRRGQTGRGRGSQNTGDSPAALVFRRDDARIYDTPRGGLGEICSPGRVTPGP